MQEFSNEQKAAGEREIDEWDLICFCSEYLIHVSQKQPWLTQLTGPLVTMVHNAHYVKGADLGLYVEPVLYDGNGVKVSSTMDNRPKLVSIDGAELSTKTSNVDDSSGQQDREPSSEGIV